MASHRQQLRILKIFLVVAKTETAGMIMIRHAKVASTMDTPAQSTPMANHNRFIVISHQGCPMPRFNRGIQIRVSISTVEPSRKTPGTL
ncbi:MAG: hypothetical protein KDA84_28815 [Planctomycetaceae bacterium]|nr:hypothetical protein [Planctomycetaceae bacterium]